MKQTKYYKEYLKALREDVGALERGINDTNRIKKLTNEGYNLFKLSTQQRNFTTATVYLKALREDVGALERGINDTNRIKKLTNEGYNLFKLSTQQRNFTTATV